MPIKKIKKWLIEYLAVVYLIKFNADNEVWKAAITTTTEKPVKRAETLSICSTGFTYPPL